MNTNTQVPATQNESWGFWGTMQEHASAAWAIALPAIAGATACEPEQVRVFLDSRHGRHFADAVQNGLYAGASLKDAIGQAIQRWMLWTIGRSTSRHFGIPHKMPYLTGFVMQAAIDEELFA